MGGGVADTEEEEGGKVGGQQLIDNSPLKLYLHFYAFDQTILLCYIFLVSNLDLALILNQREFQ